MNAKGDKGLLALGSWLVASWLRAFVPFVPLARVILQRRQGVSDPLLARLS